MAGIPNATDSLDDLARWARRPSARSELRAAVGRIMTGRLWATRSLALHRPDPYWHERFRVARGQALADEPANRAWTERYTLDAGGRPVAVDEYWSEQALPEYVEYVLHGEGAIASLRFAGEKLVAVYQAWLTDGRLQRMDAVEQTGAWSETYRYGVGGGLVEIAEPALRDPPGALGWRQPGGDLTLTYRSDGTLLTIVNQTSGETVYRAPACDLDTMLDHVVARVGADVKAWVSDVAPGEPVASAALVYDDPISLIPEVALETAGLRTARLKGADRAASRLWTPLAPAFVICEPPLHYDFSWLEEIQPALEQELALSAALEVAPAVLRRVARALNGGWQPPFPTTADFVVYCVDHESEDMEADVRASLPAGIAARILR
jgi:hypothetical protein